MATFFFFIVGLSVKGCETMHFTLDGETLPFILSSPTEGSAAFYGYRTDSIIPYDNFPFTKHVESIALLSKE